MSTISSDRLAGVLAGFFIVRAMGELASFVMAVTFPVGNFTDQLVPACLSLIAVLVSGLLGLGCLYQERKRWLHVALLAFLFLSACGSVVGLLVTLDFQNDSLEKLRPSMVGRSLMELIMVLMFMVVVVVLIRKIKDENSAAEKIGSTRLGV